MSEYSRTGVDVHKKGIEVFKESIDNLFPDAFCTISRDPDFPEYGIVHHIDGQGSKAVENWLMYKLTGETKWFGYAADDILAMNIDDVYCVNARPISFVDYISINKFTCPKQEVLRELNNRIKRNLDIFKRYGIDFLRFSGGETADLPDQVRTLDVVGAVYARVKLADVIDGSKLSPGNLIVGLRTGGRATYEDNENSGLMSNGATLARHKLTAHKFEEEFPEMREPKGATYEGRYSPTDHLEELGMTIGESLCSPTRNFAPITKAILEKHLPEITGIVHNTGGGQTKCLRLGKNVKYIKDHTKEGSIQPDPIFSLIQRESKESWSEMFRDYNMGFGMDFIVDSMNTADEVISISEKFGVGTAVIGYVEKSDGANKLIIKSMHGTFSYP